MKHTRKHKISRQWAALLKLTETKIKRSSVKTAQLQAIIEDFRRQALAGEPCPTDTDALSKELH